MTVMEYREQLKTIAETMAALKASILTMCDDMDATNDIFEKEKIRIAIIKTERLLGEAEKAYNETVVDINIRR